MAASQQKELHQASGHRVLFTLGLLIREPLFNDTTRSYHPLYNPEKRLFCGYTVKSTSPGMFVVCAYTVEQPYDLNMPEAVSVSFPQELCECYRQQMRERLEPLGVWDEGNFGLTCFV